jgi:hypothetical protein
MNDWGSDQILRVQKELARHCGIANAMKRQLKFKYCVESLGSVYDEGDGLLRTESVRVRVFRNWVTFESLGENDDQRELPRLEFGTNLRWSSFLIETQKREPWTSYSIEMFAQAAIVEE